MLLDQEELKRERNRTNPDFVLFTPTQKGYEDDNVHLHVVYHEQFGGLMAFWTQSSFDSYGDNHAVMATSKDGGVTWTQPRYIIGTLPGHGTNDLQASWAFPVVSKSGRIYLFYYRETGYFDTHRSCSSKLACLYSDDFGENWSDSVDIAMPISPYDGGEVQNDCLYQMPRRLPDGRYLFAYQKLTSYKLTPPGGYWYLSDQHIFFMLTENLDDDPAVEDLRFTFLPDDPYGIANPFPNEKRSSAQEPCWVSLPDGRLFCDMRTAFGYISYTVSSDGGHTWTKPEPLRFSDGTLFVHPCSPCPIYDVKNGKYVVLYHGHAEDIGSSRNPLYRAIGTFAPNDYQPIRFDKKDSELYMSLPDDAFVVGHPGNQLTMYGSITYEGERTILWYPERKCFLLGKYLF